MCSAVFISGRDLMEAERDSGPLLTENIGIVPPQMELARERLYHCIAHLGPIVL
jgi:hypothetical protein